MDERLGRLARGEAVLVGGLKLVRVVGWYRLLDGTRVVRCLRDDEAGRRAVCQWLEETPGEQRWFANTTVTLDPLTDPRGAVRLVRALSTRGTQTCSLRLRRDGDFDLETLDEGPLEPVGGAELLGRTVEHLDQGRALALIEAWVRTDDALVDVLEAPGRQG
jgi:hypothetical protein